MVIVAPGFIKSFSPATKSLRSGTCASTFLPSTRSPCPRSAASRRAVAAPRNSTAVGTPLAIATSATFAAGSTP